MNICSALITDFQTTIAVQPGKGSFDYPTMFTKPFLTFYSAPGNSWSDPACSQGLAIMPTIVPFVGVQFLRTLSRATTLLMNSRDGIHHSFQHGRFMHIGSRVSYNEWDSSSFDHNMALRARFAAICWVRAGRFAPPGAGTMPASRLARDQSNCSAPASFSNSVWCSRSQTPAACQSRNRRQQVIPLPQPISAGSVSQGMPVCRTNKTPAKTARLETRGLPPFGFLGSGGSRGSILCHSSSLTNCFAMPQSYQFLGFC